MCEKIDIQRVWRSGNVKYQRGDESAVEMGRSEIGIGGKEEKNKHEDGRTRKR